MSFCRLLTTDDDSRHAMQSCRSKQENIDRLHVELKSMEERAASIQQQIDTSVNELSVRIFTDHVTREGTKISRVCLFVSTSSDRWPRFFACAWDMTVACRRLKLES